MLEENNISTDVDSTATSPGAAADVQADSPVGVGGGEQTEGGATTETPSSEAAASAAAETEVGGTEAPSPDIPETDDDLKGQEHEPHVQQYFKYRQQIRALKGELEEVKGKASSAEPVLPLVEQYGGADTVKTRLEAYDSLFTPVVDQATQQPMRDPMTGMPVIDPTPFIQTVDAENPGIAERLTLAGLNYVVETDDGQQARVYQLPMIRDPFLKACGLDPNRLDDYRNIDALSAPQDTGAITPEELAEVPAEFHDVYKTLPPGIRADLKLQDEQTRQFNLSKYQRDFDREQADQRSKQEAQAARQQQEQAARAYVAREQDSYVSRQIQEGYAAIMDDLASQVTFSDDPGQNAVMHGMVGSYLLALRDPDSRFITEKTLEHLGVKVEPSFYESLEAADLHYREAKAYELYNQQGMAQKARTEANKAKTQVIAKLSIVAQKAAKALGAAVAAKANREGQALQDATRTRPVPGDGSGASEQNGILPAGMRADSPEAGIWLWRQTQAQHTQGG